jgi:hypothetical protein
MRPQDTVRDENAQVTATPAAATLDNDRFELFPAGVRVVQRLDILRVFVIHDRLEPW